MVKRQDIYQDIIKSVSAKEKLLAVLIDPDKFLVENTRAFIEKVNASIATHVFVGGSTVDDFVTDTLVAEIKKHTGLPIVLFPGDITQITGKADAILFLSLLSGRNPEYLIGKHVEAVSKLDKTELQVISTGYILIESGKETAVQRVTKTNPIPRNEVQKIINTAKAGQLLGMKLIYLEAGSGAENALSGEIIKSVKNELNIPLIVGGGIRSKAQLEQAYKAGADLVVIGTAFEDDDLFFEDLKMIN
ncbi:geranylgeranylglyceryl/heptaprenylglyceryl phosphate synthase [Algibacter amylolyticus]|uniref:Geranylgeranylglyceryl phosphate synthase n=1 Tax=Algibacter amylolyticus TaxID=1608400 RepID=A0A5M7BE20_9FLAO|nr:geranylgeranylglyceryl/heptaprenylglyceryl phosphate synthase [Algibacter amylolyticus]KAA5827856.1 geranylgeranylglyceryl/heptaprenylglyceryl phosphate synthase [Algibacter amylolyticus]MBB5267086.1 putative glycerol-1-phosphate prenyltransferase [Algibacter amylolyticus]TSJ82101.1 geranylgeranylglyceryl/heptaprenylglyceryl phosphate synthase [Algibacter amylolyticus]